MNWETLIPIIFAEVLKCLKAGRAESDIAAQIRNPNGFARLRLERQVRQDRGLTRRQWRQQGEAVMAPIYDEARSASDEDIKALIDEARDDEA